MIIVNLKNNEQRIINHGKSLGARKINVLEKYDDGSLKVLYICGDFNICYKIKGSLFDQVYIDYP